MSYYISGRNGFCRILPLLPSFPPQTACLQHLQTFIFLPWSSSTLCYQILSPSQFPIFITPKLLNSPPLCLSPSPAFSSITLLSFFYFPLIPSHSPSPPLIFILPSQTSALPPPHIHKPFFPPSPAILWHSYPLIPYLSVPLFTPTHHPLLLLPSSHLIPFVSSPTGSLSLQFVLSSCPPCPLHPSQILGGALFVITQTIQLPNCPLSFPW